MFIQKHIHPKNIIIMKQQICDAVYEAVKKYNPAIFTHWKD